MKKNTGKAPSIQFYYKDWLADERLKMCSLRAKGLWIEIICQSVSMPVPGVFAFKNESKTNQNEIKTKSKRDQNENVLEPICEQKLLQMFTGKPSEKRKAFDELKRYGVVKQNEYKMFYVKRVKEDMELRAKRIEAGKKGGNPDLIKNKVKNLDNQNANQNPTPSTSTSSSTSSSTSISNIIPTLEECIDAAFSVGVTEDQASEFFHHYDAQGWVWGNGQPMTGSIQACLARWRNNAHRFENKKPKQSEISAIELIQAESR